MARISVRVGDVFRIPVEVDRHIYGQVIDQSGPQYLVVVFPSTVEPVDHVVTSGIELAGIVFDAKWRNGDWPVVTNLPTPKVKAPWFVIGHEGLGNLRVESFDGSVTRAVNPAEAARHGHRTLSGPMVLQMAAAASHGFGSWKEDFNHFRQLAAEMTEGFVGT